MSTDLLAAIGSTSAVGAGRPLGRVRLPEDTSPPEVLTAPSVGSVYSSYLWGGQLLWKATLSVRNGIDIHRSCSVEVCLYGCCCRGEGAWRCGLSGGEGGEGGCRCIVRVPEPPPCSCCPARASRAGAGERGRGSGDRAAEGL